MDVLIDAIGFSLPPQGPTSQPQQSRSALTRPDAANDLAPASTPQSRPSPTSHNNAGLPHRCHLCSRTYERADHLNRHLKSHENARPHKCSRCTKSFNRADLLNRHEASHDRQVQGDARPRIERGERVAMACQACVQSKSKCHDQKPCRRCVKRGIACERSSIWSRDNVMTSPIRTRSMRGAGQDDNMGAGNNAASHGGYEIPNSRFNDNFSSPVTGPHPSAAQQQVTSDIQTSGYYHEPHASHGVFFEDPYQNFAYPPGGDSPFNQDMGFMPQDSYFSQDMDIGMWDFDLDSVELSYNSNSTQGEGSTRLQTKGPRNLQKDASKRFAAFERSPWLWTPTQKDQALDDQENLELDEDRIPPVLEPASPATSMDDFSSFSITSRVRDQMLSLLFTLRNSPTKAPSFPSLSLLNNIIQIYFVQESFRFDQLIHTATFDSKNALPHLYFSIVAAGSTHISTPAIWKMGLALQELVRPLVANLWEANNSYTRSLQTIQAFVIGLDVGLWSGFKRKMEISEAFAQPVIIMMRRAGIFAAALRNPSIFIPNTSDSLAILESKWRKWVEGESWKRLTLHLYIHDIQASLGFQKPPLISFTELKLALPASRELWLAKSAVDWRDRYLSASSSTTPATNISLADAMQTLELLTQYSTQVDVHLSAVSLLHGFWSQIWTLLESKKFYPPSKATHRLCLLTGQTELYRDLSAFSSLLPSFTKNSAEATLIAELFMMLLHASPEDLHRFAGKFGEDEAKKASVEFTEWARTTDSRIAVWHAGQAFRAAKRLGQAQCRGFNAIAVYYASLTLWIYGLMTSTSHPSTSSPQESSRSWITLNEAENSITRNWRSTNDGVPGLNVADPDESGEHFISLEDTDQVLQFGRDVYTNNFPGDSDTDGSVPPLVENLGSLLRDLGSLPGSRISRTSSKSAG